MAPNLSPPEVLHSVPEIERALAHIWADAATHRGDGEHHVAARSSVLNLVVIAGPRETSDRCAAIIEATAGRHPSRSLILSALDDEGRPGLDATIQTVAVGVSALKSADKIVGSLVDVRLTDLH